MPALRGPARLACCLSTSPSLCPSTCPCSSHIRFREGVSVYHRDPGRIHHILRYALIPMPKLPVVRIMRVIWEEETEVRVRVCRGYHHASCLKEERCVRVCVGACARVYSHLSQAALGQGLHRHIF